MADSTHILPDWSEYQFLVLDPSRRWAPAIQREFSSAASVVRGSAVCVFESCDSTKDMLLSVESRRVLACILFLQGLERECMGLQRRLSELRPDLPLLLIGTSAHRELLPVLYEAGATTVLLEVQNDVLVSDWCERVMRNRSIGG